MAGPKDRRRRLHAIAAADPGGRVPRRHARIWLPEGGFVLHHLAGGRYATVLGEKPLRWAAQEDGGEIVIGPHRLRFDSVVSAK